MKNHNESIINQGNTHMKGYLIASISVLLFLLAFHPKGYSQIFVKHNIDQNFPGICIIKIFDLDLDGDHDIIGGSEHTPWTTSSGIAWWRNDGGYPVQWTKFQISTSFLHVMSVDAGYINNDSLPDIVTSSWENGKISWWKNNGDPTQNWTEYNIVSGWTNAHDAKVYDIDNDGNNDIVGVSAGNNKISVFYNQGGTYPTWEKDIITSTFNHPLSVNISDLNTDGLPDIISGADGCDDIAWWKNSGGSPSQWEKFTITNYLNGAGNTNIIDIDQDGQLDIIGAGYEGNEISFWICDDISTNSWTKNLVTNQLETAVSCIGSDIDLDGDIDVVAVGKNPGKLAIYNNNSFAFTETVLNPDFLGGAALAIIDIDDDGDDDIISGAGVAGDLFLYENTTISNVKDLNFPNNSFTIYPNPFTNSTTIEFEVKEHSKVSLKIYDLHGKEVTTLINGYQTSGTKTIIWDGRDNTGSIVSSGLYYCVIKIDRKIYTEKIIKD